MQFGGTNARFDLTHNSTSSNSPAINMPILSLSYPMSAIPVLGTWPKKFWGQCSFPLSSPLKTSPRCKVAAASAAAGVVVMLRCCFHQFATQRTITTNGGINEIIGTVWMITLSLSLLNLLQIFFQYLLPPLEHPDSGLPGSRLFPDHLSPRL